MISPEPELVAAWRSACADTVAAYEQWHRGTFATRRDNYAVYLAAADREQSAEQAVLLAVRTALSQRQPQA